MSYANVSLKQRSFGETMRRGAWWTQPLFVFLGLSTFLVYSTWAALQGTHYWLDQNGANYLSPFYSPEFFGSSPHAIFGPKPGWWPSWLPFLARVFGSVGSGGFSVHLLLLSRRLLQSVLGRPDQLRRRRTAKGISGRKFLPAHHAEHSPLLPLPGAVVHSRPRARRLEGDVVHGCDPAPSISASALERLC